MATRRASVKAGAGEVASQLQRSHYILYAPHAIQYDRQTSVHGVRYPLAATALSRPLAMQAPSQQCFGRDDTTWLASASPSHARKELVDVTSCDPSLHGNCCQSCCTLGQALALEAVGCAFVVTIARCGGIVPRPLDGQAVLQRQQWSMLMDPLLDHVASHIGISPHPDDRMTPPV